MPAIKKRPVVKKTISRKKKTKAFSTGWKVALAGLLLVLLSPFYYGYVIKVASATWFWMKHPNDDKNYRTYESFNIKIPKK